MKKIACFDCSPNPEGELRMYKVGDKVHYQPDHYGHDKWENGIVKEVREGITEAVWVVYNCNNDWIHHREYTSARTRLEDLKPGWRNK